MTVRLSKLFVCVLAVFALFAPLNAAAQEDQGGFKLEFSRLWNNHPFNRNEPAPARMLQDTKVGDKIIPKGSPSFLNQCAIRMGTALREAGVTMSQIGNPRVSWYHPKDRMYVLVAQELANGLSSANINGLGKVIKVKDPKNFHKELFGKKGIIFFKDYWRRSGEKEPTGDHIDVWNGYRTSAKWLIEWFSWIGYTENYGFSKEIWFWEVEQ